MSDQPMYPMQQQGEQHVDVSQDMQQQVPQEQYPPLQGVHQQPIPQDQYPPQQEGYPQQVGYPPLQSQIPPQQQQQQPGIPAQFTSQAPRADSIENPNANPIVAVLLSLIPLLIPIVPPLGYIAIGMSKKQLGTLIWYYVALITELLLYFVLVTLISIIVSLTAGFGSILYPLALIAFFLPAIFSVICAVDSYRLAVRLRKGEPLSPLENTSAVLKFLPLCHD